jgi:hypothetical protein
MPVIDLRNFQGEVPKMGPSMLDPTQAQRATNCRVVSGELRPLKKPVKVFQPANQPVSIYRISNGAASRWLTYTNDTDIVQGVIGDVTDFRVYTTDGIAPKKTNWNLATASGTNNVGPFPLVAYNMGIANPTVALTLAATGTGTGTVVTRAYVYTFLETFGTLVEESGPSPAATVGWQTGQSVTVSGLPSAGPSGNNVTATRVYRTVTGTTGAIYEWVADVAIGTTSFTDAWLDSQLPGTPLPSLTWVPPPNALRGLINMGYGVMAGFVGNTLYFCEPNKPHAWPVQYTLSFPNNIIGLGLSGTQLVVCTDGFPWLVSGTTPGQMSQSPITIAEPCVSKRSIVSNLTGMMYASPNGLVGISSIIQGVITDKLIEREAWTTFNPTTMIGAIYDGRYIGFYTLPTGIPQTDGYSLNLGGRAMVLDKADEPIRALYTHMDVASFALAPPLTFMDFYASGAYTDRQTGNLYAVNTVDNGIYQIDGDPVNSLTANWKSKRFLFGAPVNMALAQVDADFNDPVYQQVAQQVAAIIAANAAVFATGNTFGPLATNAFNTQEFNGSALVDVPTATDLLTFQILVYANGQLLVAYNPQDNEPMRLPDGFRAQQWEVEIAANYPVRSVTLATSMKELRDAVMQPQQQGGQ